MRYYIKKISRQDKTRTFVINTIALKQYFNLALDNRNDSSFIYIQYPNSKNLNQTKIVMKQDARLFIKRNIFDINDLIIFKKEIDLNRDIIFFKISIMSHLSNDYKTYKKLMKNNYLITDSINYKKFKNNDILNHTIKVSVVVKKD